MDALLALKSAIQAGVELTLLSSAEYSNDAKLSGSSIGKAQYLYFPSAVPYLATTNGPDTSVALDTTTRYHTNNKTAPVSLRTVYNAWLTRDLKGPEYISQANEQNIQHLRIIERVDLLGWLKGDQDSENIKDIEDDSKEEEKKGEASSQDSNPSEPARSTVTTRGDDKTSSVNPLDIVTAVEETLPSRRPPTDPTVDLVYKHERTSLDHNSALHGSKVIDFSHIAKDCREKIINVVKNAHRAQQRNAHSNQQRSHQGRNPYDRNPNAPSMAPRPSGLIQRGPSLNAPTSQRGRPKDPIILLSPSTSALLNMGNVKSFLEGGEFIPRMPAIGDSDYLQITRYSNKLSGQSNSNSANGRQNGTKIRFAVVDNVEKFTKPEHWDRVVAVFVTGQAWQFRSYRWPSPNDLFQHVAGFYLTYQGERVPPELGTWRNVTITQIPKNERFRDREASEVIWNQIEKWMLSKGWKF